MVFLGPRAMYCVGIQDPRCTTCSIRRSANNNFRISAQMQHSQHYQNLVTILPSKPKCSVSPLCCLIPTAYFLSPYLFHLPTLYFAASLLLKEGRAGLPGNLQIDNFFRPITTNVQPLTTLPASFSSSSSSRCLKR